MFLETLYQINTLLVMTNILRQNNKSKIKAKNKLYQVYVRKGRQETDFCALEESLHNLNDLILQTKTSYYKNLGK